MAIARGSGVAFRDQLRGDDRVSSVTASAAYGLRLSDINEPDAGAAPAAVTKVQDTDLSALQWDMRQIHAFEAQSITRGSRNVVVGDIDTGLDYTHPKLAPNVDFRDSVSCINGKPDQTPVRLGRRQRPRHAHRGDDCGLEQRRRRILGGCPACSNRRDQGRRYRGLLLS